ncbi:SLC25A21 [Bugula neritina]|uniref:Mitochondrial 2-oxodicarboxylate carrier n=1 Tax=Bugula neritina TaxID=10212 RepID=A0A7J7J0G2_BUGNE|nr:SLC25A21 [Bugula neritina]
MCCITILTKKGVEMPTVLTVSKQHAEGKLALMQLTAGGIAGLSEICLLHPLDVIKTRFQLQKAGTSAQYSSLGHCFTDMYRTEGLLSFYKGILPPIMAETPKRGTKFLVFEQYKRLFLLFDGISQPYVFLLAGFLSGCTEAFVVNPFETVKVKLQSERMAFAAQQNAFALAREILKKDGFGLRGLNKGLTATICRHGIFNLCYFGFYHNARVLLTAEGETLSIPFRLLLGFIAGSLASVCNIPWDVAKSRIQGPQPEPNSIKYKSTVQTIRLVVKEEGCVSYNKPVCLMFHESLVNINCLFLGI